MHSWKLLAPHYRWFWSGCVVAFLLLCASFPLPAGEQPAKEGKSPSGAPLFETDIQPIFKAKCTGCHNPDARKADLDLTTLAGLLKGSESGEIIDRKAPEKSTLYEMVHEGYMPPDEKTPPVTAEEQKLLLQWLSSGMKSRAVVREEQLSQHNILPILYLRCTVCHGKHRQEAGLDLRSRAAMLKGGKSGPAIVPGRPEESLLLKRIHAKEMPPRKLLIAYGVRPAEPPEIDKLTKWIAQGAREEEIRPDAATGEADPLVSEEDRQFWAFQPPIRPEVPRVKNQHRVRNAIDAFLLRKLEEQGLSFSPEADRVTLIRRVAFDLTGLPPKWEEVEHFLADDSPRAYEEMVERYLASPRYGERWGQYWLDVAGYADSEGKRSADVIRQHAWRYRDYVIRAFNSDKPYDRFLLEQIAGDELVDYENAETITPEITEPLVATGFLRMAPDGTGSDIVNTVVERMEVVADELHVLGSGVMGLTIQCAQCHSHKYDPIPQRDYYRLVDTFKGAYDVYDWLKSSSLPTQTRGIAKGRILRVYTAEEKQQWEAAKAVVQKQIDKANDKLAELQQKLTEKHLDARLAKLPEELRDDLRKTLAVPPDERDEIQKYLASKFEKRLRIDADELKKLEPEFRKQFAAIETQINKLQGQMPPEPGIRALWDRGNPSPTYVFRRGEATSPGPLVGPGFVSVLTDGETPFEAEPPHPGSEKTGRRLAFARWLTDPDHPLTARVMVNRIWHHHFGRGIVKSLDNFGKTGAPPTHPDLLDWLAREFTAQNWSVKHIHRLIMNSSAYRQVADGLDEAGPENALVSRMPLKRMEAEVLRDSILAVAGELVEKPYGEPDPVAVRADGLVTSRRGNQGWRRSIYVLHRRKEMPTILENFDLPQMIPNCIERPTSTVSSQALHLMNNAMIRDLAGAFARRVRNEVGDDPYRQVERVYQIALSRMPSDAERDLSQETLMALTAEWKKHVDPDGKDGMPKTEAEAAEKALANFCHTLINSAAFLYID